MSWFDLLIAVLAVWRLALLVAKDEGPLELFHRLRSIAGAYAYRKDGEPASALGRFVTCVWCLSVWFAVPWAVWLTVGFGPANTAFRAFGLVLAISGAVVLLHGVLTLRDPEPPEYGEDPGGTG